LAERLFEIYYGKKLPQATSIDAMQQTPLQPMQDELLLARAQGSAQIIGRTGTTDAWFPLGYR